MRKLYKTTIVIWSEYDPENKVELEDLARDAVSGESYCASMKSIAVDSPKNDPDWDGTEFFDVPGDDESEKGSEVCESEG